VPRLSPLVLLAACAAAAPASAAEVACHFEGGVITVPAIVAGLPGDYILDTGTAQTQLHETRAQAEGITETDLAGDVRIGDAVASRLPLKVADLDVRGVFLPTPLAGVIGADALKGFVVDVSYAPCRVRLSPPGRAPRFAGRTLPLGWDQGRPTIQMSVADDRHRLTDRFVVATGANVALRLADDLAAVADAEQPAELYPDGVWLARLPEARFAGAVGRDLPAGLMTPDGGVAGVLGGPALAHFRLRFDFPAGTLIAQPKP
jgi:hypothetical protein